MPTDPAARSVSHSSSRTLGPVHLNVADADQTARLWTEIVGLQILRRSEARLDLGLAGKTLLTLHGGAHAPASRAATGLFHVALELPSRLDLARAAQRLLEAGQACAGQDHLVNESVYFSDRDGIAIELTVATPERARVTIENGHPRFETLDGVPHTGMSRLDMRRLLDEATEHGPGERRLPPDTFVGHVHFRSNAPESTVRFYTEHLGFRPHMASMAFGMFDCGTAARPHLVALNHWSGRNLPKPSAVSAGLRYFTIEMPEDELATAARLAALPAARWEQGRLRLSDPDGNGICLSPG